MRPDRPPDTGVRVPAVNRALGDRPLIERHTWADSLFSISELINWLVFRSSDLGRRKASRSHNLEHRGAVWATLCTNQHQNI